MEVEVMKKSKLNENSSPLTDFFSCLSYFKIFLENMSIRSVHYKVNFQGKNKREM